ncbi:helix-turn-helix domain-containing protein [Microbulbifer thermotolerans]|uniref:helix-turn-helix domain-containing protein n=1 Tax=Microbulbifer thermotolerans TaxID=252514 RepID=UPI0022492F0F|nr:helix-turn-helix domain-containing protein [Microbulbifer thermotolerans]MCX2794762.1 helix-turn-helix domain-containing protein [Microbulbifer thermotolerans]
MDILLFNFHDVVLLMTSYQCTLFGLLLFVVKRENRLSNLFLALFLFSQALIPIDILISFGAGFRQWAIQTSPNLFYVFGFAYWLEGPLLLWYTRSLIYRDYRLTRFDLVYLLPFAAYALYEYFDYFRFDTATKVAMLQNYNLYEESILTHGIGFAREALRLTFGILCLLEVRSCRRQIRDSYSNIETIDFKWLLILVWGFLVIRGWAVLVNIAIIFSAHLDTYINYRLMGLASNYTVFILVSAMIFFSLSYSSMFEGLESGEEEAGDKKEPAGGEKIAVDMALVEKLSRHMQEAKPFLEPALTLEQLANQLGVPRRTLSMTINRHFERNFFEFVNHYRIEEAKARLADPECADQTVMEIMLESGFNTKATFNSLFKKLVGMTPTQYRQRNRPEEKSASARE